MSKYDYRNILKPYRYYFSDKVKAYKKINEGNEDIEEQAYGDYSRVLYSPPIRRLQRKAQVFSLEDNAAVRSRFAHSLEVADVGKRICKEIIDLDKKKSKKSSGNRIIPIDLQIPFTVYVETACLIHDLGNPPFGHFGEMAIQKWFSTKGKKVWDESIGKHGTDTSKEREEFLKDFIYFDGNPQGFRIISKLQSTGKDSNSGLNLSYPQLLSSIKYPKCSSEITGKGKTKFGYFISEKKRIDETANDLAFNIKEDRFPLSLIMEIADDISYCISDIDDGIEKKIICAKDIIDYIFDNCEIQEKMSTSEELKKVRGYTMNHYKESEIPDMDLAFLSFKTSISRWLRICAAQSYYDNHKKIMDGERVELFVTGTPEALILKLIKEFSREKLFRESSVEKMELTGYSVIFGLLNIHKRLLALSPEKFKLLVAQDPTKLKGEDLDYEWRLFNRLPKSYINCYSNSLKEDNSVINEWFLRAHLIVDYISGMTDTFALSTYRELTGIHLP